MGRCRNLGQFAQQLHVLGTVIEVVVAHQAAEGFSPQSPVLLFVELLERRALVPRGAFVAFEGLVQILLGDVEHPDLQHLVRLAIGNEIVQTSPRAFELLEIGVMHDRVDLRTQLLVDLGDHPLNTLHHVGRDELGAGQGLLGQGSHSTRDFAFGSIGLGIELLVEQRGEIGSLISRRASLDLGVLCCFSHGSPSLGRFRDCHSRVWAPRPAPAAGPDRAGSLRSGPRRRCDRPCT